MTDGDESAWRSRLQQQLESRQGDPTSRFFSMATVRADGRPAVRTVVFRGFLPDGDELIFTTDLRSAKVKQLTARPEVEVCWHSIGLRVQWRIAGRAWIWANQLATAKAPLLAQLAREVWKSTSPETRRQFAWATPGEDRQETAAAAAADSPGDEPPSNFAMILLQPDRIDELELTESPHRRTFHWRNEDASWRRRAVNP